VPGPDHTARIVRAVLHHYASRGTFRSFSEVAGPRGRMWFRFLWYRDITIRLEVDPASRSLVFQDLLPGVPARSAMDRAFRGFVAGRSARSVVEHRRVDLRRMAVRCINRGGALSLHVTLRPAHAEYGARKAVHLVHDVLIDFLSEGQYAQYQIDHLNLDPERA
jgi:hypothetical protein